MAQQGMSIQMAGQYGGQPVYIINPTTEHTQGKDALSMNINAAKAVAKLVRSTLGPKGMDKMLVNILGDIVLTNDGATILKEMEIEHPTAKMIVEVAKTQEDIAGDGTTSAVVLAGSLMDKAGDLLEKGIHPIVIFKGYNLATEKAIEILENFAIKVDKDDRKTLEKIAETSITGKAPEASSDHLAKVCVDAVLAIEENGKYNIDEKIVIRKEAGGKITDTEVIQGIYINKYRLHPDTPAKVEGAKIALLDMPIEFAKTNTKSKIQLGSVEEMFAFRDQEMINFHKMLDTVIATGANVVFSSKNIDDNAVHYLMRHNIFTCRRLKDEDMAVLSLATGAKLVRNMKEITADDLGSAEVVEQESEYEEKTLITGFKKSNSVTILIKAGSEHLTDNIERAFDDALNVVKSVLEDKAIVPGGGASEMQVAQGLRSYASTIEGREQLAIHAFADAMEEIPKAIAENAGLDKINMLLQLRAESGKNKNSGINVYSGKVEDMIKNNVIDPLRVKTQAIKSASEVSAMILRVDDMLRAQERDMQDVNPAHNVHNYNMG
ncbi:chaperonin GroEL [Methanomethylovorans hollandica DSM 15978]|uniref:Chaperonin GroEL n=1 Tax=Methanomethylovorans hollandica (strain DSM 15978 / NBRC 107637 / DMS1) TaxID=867904 RepID=L0L0J1_METHD|nr:molecular chaperone GroEL [Methanomethylovorans hollandica]AGB49888.1 chaperonin GroEL [Methanomethylovorans hollandica DSM 15978]